MTLGGCSHLTFIDADGVEWLTMDDMRMGAAVMALAAAVGFDDDTRLKAHSPHPQRHLSTIKERRLWPDPEPAGLRAQARNRERVRRE